MNNIFGTDGVLAQHLAQYEPRPGQQEMADAVLDLLEKTRETCDSIKARCLVVEAETGLGKTLAYLIPAVTSGRKVVISTNTRNLQDQILQREIPFIQHYIDPDVQALCVKGRQNYLCLYRWRQLQATHQAELFTDDATARITQWVEETTFSDRAELPWLSAADPLWQKICCLSHFCLGGECPENTGCFLNRLRRAAAASRLLIVNHHLLFSDLAVRSGGYGEVLPRYEAVIFDEAHHVENVATTFFGFSFSRHQTLDLVSDVERSAHAALTGDHLQAVLTSCQAVSGNMEQLTTFFPAERGRFLLHDLLHEQPAIRTNSDLLGNSLSRLADQADSITGENEPWEQYALRAEDLQQRLTSITTEPFYDCGDDAIHTIHWYERTEKNLTLSATPIDIAEKLQEALFTKVSACVFTSATLTSGGDFTYFDRRLGLPADTRHLSFPSPFDYAGQTLLYVPDDSSPEPASPGYPQFLHKQIEQLLTLSKGRALLLFTSFQAMDKAFYAMRDIVPYPLLLQGTAPRHRLLSHFLEETNSILFAVASFWEGVDIPGESLSMVIIDKLPFEVPSDPVIMARINRIKAQGGNPFFEFQVPRAILSLRQGVGRLMRSSSDRGVIAILDVRLFSKRYGSRFLKSLPPSPVHRDIDQVALFFQTDHD